MRGWPSVRPNRSRTTPASRSLSVASTDCSWSCSSVNDTASTATALVDLIKESKSQGIEPGWLTTKLFAGERPVSVRARIRSGGGTATVDVERVEISGLAIDGRTLDFLIQNIVLQLYPTAVIGKPFELGDRIERFDVQPAGVGVIIGK